MPPSATPGEAHADKAAAQASTGSSAAATKTAGFARTFDSLKDPHFRLYWFANLGLMAGMNMQMVARSWYMYFLTEQPAMVGAVSLTGALPMLVLSPFGGVIADRLQKKQIMVAGQVAFAAISLGVALAIELEVISPAYLIVASLFHGGVMGLMMPSRQAIISEIVGAERITNAVSLNMVGQNINRLAAPALAGFLIEQMGIAWVYFTISVLNVIGALLAAALRHTSAPTSRRSSAWTDMKEGILYIRRNTTVLHVLLFALISTLLSMPYMFLLPVVTEEVLHVGAQSLGFLWSATGAGAVVGSLIVASYGNRNRGRLLLLSTLVLSLSLIAFSASRWYMLSLLLIVPAGLGHAGRMALSNTLAQSYAEDEYRGRVMSVYMMEFGMTSLSVFGVSVLAQVFGIQWAIGGAAALLTMITLYYYLFVSALRRVQ